jgi:flagellar basal body P-ring protein FlgI
MIFMTLLKQVKIKYIREQFLAGVVINKRSGLQIAGAKVTLSDSNHKVLKNLRPTTADSDLDQ